MTNISDIEKSLPLPPKIMNKISTENFHSTCKTCNKLVPNQHFDCDRELKNKATLAERERLVSIISDLHCGCSDKQSYHGTDCKLGMYEDVIKAIEEDV